MQLIQSSISRHFVGKRALKKRAFSMVQVLVAAPFLIAVPAKAAFVFWDGGATNIAADGDGQSSYVGGTWSTAISNWDNGVGPHIPWTNGDSAIFGGPFSTTPGGLRTVTLGSSVTVDQIKILTGDPAVATSGNRYDFGATTDITNAITFGGNYDSTFPAIDASASNVRNNNFGAKITGTIAGGLVITHGSASNNFASGRFALTNPDNNFVGDVVLVSGNLSNGSNLGNAANKLNLAGGSYFASGSFTHTFSRDIIVSANSGINLNSTVSTSVMDLTGRITGTGNLTRYNSTVVSELKFSGDMSGYTGTVDNTGVGTMTIQTTAASSGAWVLSNGILKLATATDDTAIANGAGKSDLIINGGTLNMNGKFETINGLSGIGGFVQNSLASTTSTLIIGDGDASAIFPGILRNNSGTGGILALTKIGNGTQVLSGINTYTGDTTINAGALQVTGSLIGSTVMVNGGTLSGTGGAFGATTVKSGGTLAPGGLIGTLNFVSSLTLEGMSYFEIDKSGTTLTADLANVSDTLTLGGILSVTATGDALLPGDSFNLFDAGVFAGDFATVNLPTLSDGSYSWNIGSLATDGIITVVPEPASISTILGGVALLAGLRRRRQ